MKNWSKTELLMLLVLVLPFCYLAFTWNTYPDQVPVHFNFKGEPDRYGSKFVGLLLLPIINVGLYFFLKMLPRIDPKKEGYTISQGSFNGIRLAGHLFLTFIFFITTSPKQAEITLSPKLLFIGMALFFLILGNYLSAVRPNYFVGIRTPWTLENEEVWKKTHRFTGLLWVLASFIFIVITLVLNNLPPFLLILFFSLISIIPIVYSYLIYQKITKSNHSHPID